MGKIARFTFLGTGTSQGVPVISCKCEVCQSVDVRDNRLRTSALFSIDNKNYVIDSGPDFRQQMLREKVQSLEAILFTHEHKDHVAGLDDIRPFNFLQNQKIDVYASSNVQKALRREFHYIFGDQNYPGLPQINLKPLQGDKVEVDGISIDLIEVKHMNMPVYGFRIGQLVYITDANFIAEDQMAKIKGCDVLIINALRIQKHPSHFNLAEALAVVKEVNPSMAYLTHISHLMGQHAQIEKELPSNVQLAYDGLQIPFGYI